MSTAYKEMTDDQVLDLIESIQAAEDRGDEAEAERMYKLIPISVSSFEALKFVTGDTVIKELIEEGYDFSLVEEKYGKNYIN